MHSIYYALTQETANIHKKAQGVPCPQPCLLVKGGQMEDIFLVIEKKVICKLPASAAPLALLSAFYCFNLHYTPGCNNLYSFFEVMFFGKKRPAKKTRLAYVLAQLSDC